MEFLGPYEIRVYRVNREYIDSYETRNLDKRDLYETSFNIEVGLSAFSAFHSSTLVNMTLIQNYFIVKCSLKLIYRAYYLKLESLVCPNEFYQQIMGKDEKDITLFIIIHKISLM